MNIEIPKFVKLEEDAILPKRQTKGSAGYDLNALEEIDVPAGRTVIVRTGIGWEMNSVQIVGLIRPRSSLAYIYNLDTRAGVIDPDYKGEIKVLLRNEGDFDYTIHKGDRIAQLIILPFATLTEEPVEEERNGGFGSTGNQ